jgi:hypothetical protein
MHLIFFTEEQSAEAALYNIIPKIIDTNEHSYQILTHNGRNDLIKKLPSKLKALLETNQPDEKYIILVDRDSNDCKVIKNQLEEIAMDLGIGTKTSPKLDGTFKVVNRIVIEELESWFIGDQQAVETAFPGINSNFFSQPKFKDPDAIKGGTCEVFERLLRRAGYYRAGLAKIDASRKVSEYMKPQLNKSRSFQCFLEGIQSIIAQ